MLFLAFVQAVNALGRRCYRLPWQLGYAQDSGAARDLSLAIISRNVTQISVTCFSESRISSCTWSNTIRLQLLTMCLCVHTHSSVGYRGQGGAARGKRHAIIFIVGGMLSYYCSVIRPKKRRHRGIPLYGGYWLNLLGSTIRGSRSKVGTLDLR